MVLTLGVTVSWVGAEREERSASLCRSPPSYLLLGLQNIPEGSTACAPPEELPQLSVSLCLLFYQETVILDQRQCSQPR